MELTALAKQGQTTITVDNPATICAGPFPVQILIKWSGGNETANAVSCSGSVVTLQEPLDRTYPVGACVEIVTAAPPPPPPVPCPAKISQTLTISGEVGKELSQDITLAEDGLVIKNYILPDGVTASIIGTTLLIQGAPEEVLIDWEGVIVIRDKAGCIRYQIDINFDVVDPCAIDNCCTYCWTMNPQYVTLGTTVTTTVTLPEHCDENAFVTLDVFQGDGVTPVLVSGQPLRLYLKSGTSTYTINAGDLANPHLVFKPAPAAQQHVCLRNCVPCVEKTERILIPPPPCSITWSLSTTTFVTGQTTNQTYTATGIPEGCSLLLEAYNGNTPLDLGLGPVTLQLTADNPTVTFPQNWPASYVGADLNWRVAATQPACNYCSISPQRIDFDVIGAPPCNVSWSFDNDGNPGSPVVFQVGQTYTVTYTAVGVPSGCQLKLQAFKSDNTPLVIGGNPVEVNIGPSGTVTSSYTWPDNTWVGTYYWKPAPSQLPCLSACTIGPAQIPFSVVASIPPSCPQPSSPSGTCGMTRTAVTVTAGQPVNYSQVFSPSPDSVTVTVTPVVSGISTSSTANTGTAFGTFNTPGSYTITFTAIKAGCPECTVTQPVIVTSGITPPPPPPPSGCPDTAGFSPKQPCGATRSQTITAGSNWSTSQTFSNTDGTTATITPSPSGVVITAGPGQSVATVAHASWPVGNYVITLCGYKASCPNCCVTINLSVTNAGSPPPPPPPPPPPVPACPEPDLMYPTDPTCGATASYTLVRGEVGTAITMQGFKGATSASVVPAGSTGSYLIGEWAENFKHLPIGVHNIVFTGQKTGCPDCVVTVQKTVLAPPPYPALTSYSNAPGYNAYFSFDGVTPVTDIDGYTQGGGLSPKVCFEGPPGATIYVKAEIATNVSAPYDAHVGYLTSGLTALTLPGSGKLCVGGGTPRTPMHDDVVFNVFSDPGGLTAVASTPTLRTRASAVYIYNAHGNRIVVPNAFTPDYENFYAVVNNMRSGWMSHKAVSTDGGLSWSVSLESGGGILPGAHVRVGFHEVGPFFTRATKIRRISVDTIESNPLSGGPSILMRFFVWPSAVSSVPPGVEWLPIG